MTIATTSPTFSEVLIEAERLRRQAEEIPQLFLSRHGDLIGRPSAWCVVTERLVVTQLPQSGRQRSAP